MRKKALIVFLCVLFILIIDQAVKIYIKSNFYPGEDIPVLGDWLHLHYTENQGMAFGTTFGSSVWSKLALSLFRVVAITGIIIYIVRKLKEQVKMEFLIALSLVLAGATGNLLDSMFYDFLFKFDPCMIAFNQSEGSGIFAHCSNLEIEVRKTGFLFGNVVDMFRFQFFWPSWMPWVGGKEVFPAIFNVADASISIGVVMVLIRQKTYFSNAKNTTQPITTTGETSTTEAASEDTEN